MVVVVWWLLLSLSEVVGGVSVEALGHEEAVTTTMTTYLTTNMTTKMTTASVVVPCAVG